MARESFDLKKDQLEDKKQEEPTELTFGTLQKRKLKSGTEDLEDNIRCVQYLEDRLKSLTDSQNPQTKDFVKYRKVNKIPNLSAVLKLAGAERRPVFGQQQEQPK